MPETTTPKDADHLLAVYLRDHFAGAAAGLALAERCRRSNEDNPLGAVLAEIAAEISTDRDSLRDIMKRLNVSEDAFKAMLGQAGELVARLKTNGVLTHYSPSSRVIELEGLLAGIDAKRNLWRSLRTAAATRPELDTAALGELIARATSQRERLLVEHERAAANAFNPAWDLVIRTGMPAVNVLCELHAGPEPGSFIVSALRLIAAPHGDGHSVWSCQG